MAGMDVQVGDEWHGGIIAWSERRRNRFSAQTNKILSGQEKHDEV
jgi:hypothetical protein